MWPYFVTFVAVALFPLALAGYGGHLAAIALPENPKKKVKALIIVWSLAISGTALFGVSQIIAYRADLKRDTKDETFKAQVLAKLQKIIDEPDAAAKTQEAIALKKTLTTSAPDKQNGPAANKDSQDEFVNIVNDRLDEMIRTDVKRLFDNGSMWCRADQHREDATREILAHRTSASKQELDAAKKSRDNDEKNYDTQQRKAYQDTAREASALERAILLRLHSSEKRGLMPDEATAGVFVRLTNGTYGCGDFKKAASYLDKLEQQFSQVNSISH